MEIQRGTLLACETADGGYVTMRALTPATQGLDFPVVWVCSPEEYGSGEAAEDGPRGIPWPLSAVQAIEGVEPFGAKAS
jgi:hypothetical protein